MSSDSSKSEQNTKVYKLKSRKNFQAWKQKTLSLASSKGYERFLLENVKVYSEADIDKVVEDYLDEVDEKERRKLKNQVDKMKKERKKSLAAAALLTMSVKSKDLKMLSKCKKDPKKMFDAIVKKYGTEEESDLAELMDDLKHCTLKSKSKDPEEWFAELDQINEQLGEIDQDFAKNEKEMAVHILSSLPKAYRHVKTNIQITDNYLDKLDDIKSQITKHWKLNLRKKKKKYESSSESSSDSSVESKKYLKKGKITLHLQSQMKTVLTSLVFQFAGIVVN